MLTSSLCNYALCRTENHNIQTLHHTAEQHDDTVQSWPQ